MTRKPPKPARRDEREPAVLHAIAVTSDAGAAGWLLRLTDAPSPQRAHAKIAAAMKRLPAKRRTWVDPARAWLIDDDQPLLDRAVEAIEDAVTESVDADVDVCSDCASSDACDAWDDAIAGFARRDLPFVAPALDPDAVAECAAALLEADEDGLATEFLGAVLDRYHRTRASPVVRPRATMPVDEAARVLGVAWPAERKVVVAAGRREAAKHHSDHGGDRAAFERVTEARRALEQALDEADAGGEMDDDEDAS